MQCGGRRGNGLCSLAGVAFAARHIACLRGVGCATAAHQPLQCGLAWPFQPGFLMLPTLSPCAEYTGAATAFKAAKPDMAQKIVSGLHFRSRSLYGPGLGVEH